MSGAESGRVEARTSCDHLPSLSSDLVHIPTLDAHCNRCQHPNENWLCLCCKELLCSRNVNQHMLQHYQQIHHSISLSYDDLSVWCYSCNAYLDAQLIPQLRPVYETAYLLKFGEAPPVRTDCFTMCDHDLSSISFNPTTVSIPDTPACKRCQRPSGNWFCLTCKEIFCGPNRHINEHYKETKHCLCVNCSTKSFYCFSCRKHHDAQATQQLWVKARTTSSKLESIDAMIVDVTDLLSKPYPSINVLPQLDAQSFLGQSELALAKEGLRKIFDCGLKALVNPKVQEEFFLYSATLLSTESCPAEFKVNFSSFRCNLSEETSAFIRAQDELKVATELSASITQRKFILRQQTSKYDEVKKEIVASDEKVSNFKATIEQLKAQIKTLEACLATEESDRAKNDEALDSIEKQITTARDGLVTDLAKVSSMEGSIQAAKQLVARKQSDWDNLQLSFTKFDGVPSTKQARCSHSNFCPTLLERVHKGKPLC